MSRIKYLEVAQHWSLFIWELLKNAYWSCVPMSLKRPKDLTGEIVLVTGAGSGLGQCLALKFARLGCRLVLVDINKSGLDETRLFLEERLGADNVHAYVCDVSDRAAVYDMSELVKLEVGPVSVLVNNAGITNRRTAFSYTRDRDLERVIEVNLMGPIWTTKAFLPGMVSARKGHLVYVSSGAGLLGTFGHTDYAASKFGLTGFAEALAQEVKFSGVEVTTAFPGHMDTPLCPEELKETLVKVRSPVQVAEDIVQGVLRGKEKIFVPQFYYSFLLLKLVASVKSIYHLTYAVMGAQYFRSKPRKDVS